MKMSTAFGDAIALVTNPVGYMTKNKDLSVPVNTIIIQYVAVLAAIPFIAALIGPLWYYHYTFLYEYAFVLAVATYIFDVIGVFVVGFLIWKLAPTFGATTDQNRGTLLAAWIFTPAFLISILNIIPFIGWITFLGLLYGLYILYLGIPILTNTPKDKVIGYVIGVVIATIIVYAILGFIVGAVTVAAFGLGYFYP
jgi:Yip1 domain